jgi:hypothetical protein
MIGEVHTPTRTTVRRRSCDFPLDGSIAGRQTVRRRQVDLIEPHLGANLAFETAHQSRT